MKKKLITGVALATLVVGGLMTAQQAPQSALSDLQMENLEVLTGTEGNFLSGVLVKCESSHLRTCKVMCKHCFTIHYRSSGIPGYCVDVTGRCKCGYSYFEKL